MTVRALMGLWLVAYAAVVALAPVADAAAGHGDVSAAHWEDPSEQRCPPAHGDLGCRYAPVLHAVGAAGSVRAQVAAPPITGRAADRPAVPAVPRVAALASLAAPRAPPAA